MQTLRAIAVLLVLTYHAAARTAQILSRNIADWGRGRAGVDIFFVLSGFVMVYSSLRLFDDPYGWKIFLERRLARVVPMYWIATTIKIAIMLMAASLVLHSSLTPSTIFLSFLFLPSALKEGSGLLIQAAWTLSFEMLFYCLFTFILYFRLSLFPVMGIVLSCFTLISFLHPQSSSSPLFFFFNSVIFEFYLGMLIARYCTGRFRVTRVQGMAIFSLGISLLLLLPEYPTIPRLFTMGLPSAMMVMAIVLLEEYLARPAKAILWIAEASYAIYLFQMLTIQIVPTLLKRIHYPSVTLSFIGCIFVGVASGAVMHHGVERPITTWLRDHLRVRHRKFIHQP
ncbi:MAG: acyltransferase [Acidobacteriaceae bacterium]|nr:acyltransferase [Acidobacteriaceae bacterium]